MVTLSITESQTMQALRGLLLALMPDGVPVVQGQPNRVSEPDVLDFVEITPVMRQRLSTNVDDYADAVFLGEIVDTTLTVGSVSLGAIVPGRTLFGTGVYPGTRIVEQLSGVDGSVGVYLVSASQYLPATQMAAGALTLNQSTQVSVQIDVHGPASADNMQIITTAFRDALAVDLLAQSGFDVVPLYCDEPHQAPFVNGELQVENRWIVTAELEVNPSLIWPLQFAGALRVGLIDVDAQYPPA